MISRPPSQTSTSTSKTRKNGSLSVHTIIPSNSRHRRRRHNSSKRHNQLSLSPPLRLQERRSRSRVFGTQRKASSSEVRHLQRRRRRGNRQMGTSIILRTRMPMLGAGANGMLAGVYASDDLGKLIRALGVLTTRGYMCTCMPLRIMHWF